MNEIRVLSPSLLPSLSDEIPSEEIFRLFREGEALRGTLVRQIDSGRAFLHLRGKDLLVESQIPLPPGVELRFRVEEVKPRVILKLLPPETPGEERISSLLKRLLSGDIPLGNLAENLGALGEEGFGAVPPALQESSKKFFHLLRNFSPSSLFSGDPAVLAKLIHESGFFWENKVRQWTLAGKKDPPAQLIEGDLKGLGSKLLGELEALGQTGGGEKEVVLKTQKLKEALEPFLRKIELYQAANLLPAEAQDRFYIFLPFWVESRLQFVELNLSFREKDSPEGEREHCTVLFLLNLPELGRVRIEVQIKEKDLFCCFRFSEPGVSDFVRQALPGLDDRLGELGYQAHLEVLLERAQNRDDPLMGELETGSKTLLNKII